VLATDLKQEINQKDEKLREMEILLDVKESETSFMSCTIENLKEEIGLVREENEEMMRISDLQTEKDTLQVALGAEKEKEWEMEKRESKFLELKMLTRTPQNMYVLQYVHNRCFYSYSASISTSDSISISIFIFSTVSISYYLSLFFSCFTSIISRYFFSPRFVSSSVFSTRSQD
jgi:hypothetical protein